MAWFVPLEEGVAAALLGIHEFATDIGHDSGTPVSADDK
jgi:hypothetical protein